MVNWITGFYQDDLNVHYENYSVIDPNIKTKFKTSYKNSDNLFKILFVLNGKASVKCENKKFELFENQIVIAEPTEKLEYFFCTNEHFEFCFIDLHPSLFENTKDELIKPFQVLKGQDRVIQLDLENNYALKVMLESLVFVIQRKTLRCHIQPRVLSFLSELSILCDNFSSQLVESSQSLSIQIVQYVKRHYTEKITYEMLKNKFCTSVPTISSIIKNSTGKTLNDYVTALRLNDAEQMLKNGMISTMKIAQLCGFKNYSTFYRAYKKHFGVSPNKTKRL